MPDEPDTSLREPPTQASPGSLRSRRRVLVALVAAAVVVSIAGLGASTLIKSPQQVAAEAGPPTASVLSVTVERRVLTESVTFRGTVAPGKTVKVPAPVPDGVKPVITKQALRTGRRVTAGELLAEVSGRPVIALPGRIPMYRDLRRGMDGPDVRQLQAALRTIGHSIHDPAGTFGSSTERAVRRLYRTRDYEPPIEKIPAKDDGASSDGGNASGRGDENADSANDKPKPKPKPESRAYVRSGEVVFVSKLPARVTKVNAGLGAEATGSILTLATGDLVVRGTLSPVDRDLVKPGMPAMILAEQKELTAEGRISSIGDFTAGAAAEAEGAGEQGEPAEPGHPVLVRGNKALDEGFSGEEVRLTVETASTGGKVLVVPASAVYATADGSTQVIKLLGNDERQRVTVTTGATSGGFVEVKSGGLAVGDRVVIGR